MDAEDSDSAVSASCSAGMDSTSICMSIRSSSGPEMRPRYRRISAGVQRHCCVRLPRLPHGHGFIDAISINRAGYVACAFTRVIVTKPSSSGWRSASSTSRRYSGNSSKNKIP